MIERLRLCFKAINKNFRYTDVEVRKWITLENYTKDFHANCKTMIIIQIIYLKDKIKTKRRNK